MPAKQKTQKDTMEEFLAEHTSAGEEVTDEVKFPGASKLHQQPRAEIAQVLTNMLKTRSNITKLEWVLGEDHIKISYISK